VGEVKSQELRLRIEVRTDYELIVTAHLVKVVLSKEILTRNDLVDGIVGVEVQLQEAEGD